ncbi:N-acetyllactosaminide alpha-1,3-galactosyltransferase-like isoform X1 [Hyperolius riggenbachi]|uniref:N-acetyllactosaminide alpha-1,3-galactosyltransferase-like isoform X1 n=1 Tax=Hyperolius riggenbachi TaxID=752182 RepID=UPI0035A2DB35
MVNRRRFLLCVPLLALSYVIYIRSLICFPQVPSVTSWGAPIIWEGTFDLEKETSFHQEHGTVVGLSVFAVKQYLENYLYNFLVSANLHFMPGLPCVFYILTDRPSAVPAFEPRPGLSVVTLQVPRRNRWQEISMLRMQDLLELVLPLAKEKVHYLICMDVDQVFTSRYGPEVLGDLMAQLHSGYYLAKREEFPYEQGPQSAAYIPPGEGQYYYHASVFGGTPSHLINLTASCLAGILKDKEQGVEAVWHDESHLNRYFALENLPLKILSPEYCWDKRLWLRYHRMVWAKKNYEKLRV